MDPQSPAGDMPQSHFCHWRKKWQQVMDLLHALFPRLCADCQHLLLKMHDVIGP
jgi:hypothetical protein